LSAATADRLWALPGATFTGMVKPQFVHGEMIRNRYSGARTGTMPCPSFLIEHRRGLVLFEPTRNFRWVEVGADFDLFGDGSVQILLSPGHTPGSLALFVRLPQRNVILTGDTCHYQIEVEHGIADALHDQALGNASLRRLILIRDAWDAQIWVGHDPEDWAAWPHSPQFVE
jgi:glyoxylase-like metal-dependent hydrolase (beta-lactamase superfamily II)